jgi:hypothetical protein
VPQLSVCHPQLPLGQPVDWQGKDLQQGLQSYDTPTETVPPGQVPDWLQ